MPRPYERPCVARTSHPPARSFSGLQREAGGHYSQVWRPGLPAR